MKRVVEINKDTNLFSLLDDVVNFLQMNGFYNTEDIDLSSHSEKEGNLILEVE